MSDREESPITAEESSDGALKEAAQCYCKGPRELGTIELQCMSCLKWHHLKCLNITESDTGPTIPFMNSYAFHCKVCSPTKCEGFLKKPATFVQMLQSTFANLLHFQQDKENDKTSEKDKDKDSKSDVPVFSKDKEIIPFIEKNWEALTLASRKTKSTWHATVTKTLGQNPTIFYSHLSVDGTRTMYGMLDTDVCNVCPNYEAAKQQGASSGSGNNANTKQSKNLKRKAGSVGLGGNNGGSGAANGGSSDSKRSRTDANSTGMKIQLPFHGHPADHPFNKDEWCYEFAEKDPYAEKEDDDEYDASKLIPPYSYRKAMSSMVYLSMSDRAPQLKLANNRLTVSGEKGYCLIKASHSMYKDCYYFEATIDAMPDNSACRIGWAQQFANNQAPLGYDSFGYSYRSRKGTRFHKSLGNSYGQGYTQGDTVGAMIQLPASQLFLPECFKDKPLIKFKNFLYYERKRDSKQQESQLKVQPSSKISFFKNGQFQGVAFSDIYSGNYYPAVSLFKNCTVTFNFGPSFTCMPSPETFNYLPFSERAISEMNEQQISDLLYLIENDRVAVQIND